MRRRKSPAIIASLVILAAVLAAAAYFRIVEFTLSARSLVVDEISAATGKRAFASSVRFDPLKGLVLDNLVIHDGHVPIVRAREVACGFLLPAVFSKRVIVPSVTITEPVIRAERSADGTLNVMGLIPKDYRPRHSVAVSVHRVTIKSGRVRFVDHTTPAAFDKTAEAVEAEIRLYLPVRVTFRSTFDLAPSRISASGEYILPEEALLANLVINDLSLKEFLPYYSATGFAFPSGSVDARAFVGARNGSVDINLAAVTRNLAITTGRSKSKLASSINGSFKYDARARSLKHHGKADIQSMEIDGVEGIGRIDKIKGVVDFNESRIFSESIEAEALDLAWKARINAVNFRDPLVDIYARSAVHLGALQKALRSGFGLAMPSDFSGTGDLRVSIQTQGFRGLRMNGSLAVEDGTMGLGSGNFPVERIKGTVLFAGEELRWDGVRCSYRGDDYTVSGRLVDPPAPHVDIAVKSKALSYKAEFAVKGNIIRVMKLDGNYLSSAFSANGSISLDDPNAMDAELAGEADIDLADIRKGGSGGVRKMKPSGKLHAAFELSGDLKDLKTCYANAMVRSKALSLYGLRFTDMSFSYTQEQGVGAFKSMRSGFYGGTLAASGAIDWVAKGLPWEAKLDTIGVKLDKMKEETPFRDRDVSGTLKIYVDLKGIVKDPLRLTGIGHASITAGKLWQLDLFKGAGKAIFSSDFGDIVFTDGACDFRIGAGGTFAVENLVLRSEELDLTGRGEIMAGRELSGILRPEIREGAVAEGATGKLAIAVGKGTVIEISGTLKEPKFKTRTNVVDVVSAFMGN